MVVFTLAIWLLVMSLIATFFYHHSKGDCGSFSDREMKKITIAIRATMFEKYNSPNRFTIAKTEPT